MNILYLVDGKVFIAKSGSSIHTLSMINAFQKRGHRVTLFDIFSRRIVDIEIIGGASCSTNNYQPSHLLIFKMLFWLSQKGARFFPRASNYVIDTECIANRFISAIIIKKLLLRLNFDFIYERESLYGDVGARISRTLNIPLLLEVNSLMINEVKRYYQPPFLKEAIKRERLSMQKAFKVLVVCDAFSPLLIKKYGISSSKVVVTSNAVNPEDFAKVDEDKVRMLREKYKLQNSLVIGFVGSMKPWHDLKTLLHAFASLLEKDIQNLKLLMIGEGEEKGIVEQIIEELNVEPSVILTGYIEHKNISAYLSLMNIATLPLVSRHKGSPVKIFEYMASGRAIIATRLLHIEQILEDRKSALLVEPENVEDLKGAIKRLIEDREMRKKLGKRARIEAEKYTWDKNVERIEKLVYEKTKNCLHR